MSIDWLNVSDTTPRIAYTATASQTAFSVPFVFFENSDLAVYQNDALLTLDTNYTVTGAEDEDGGAVTLLVGATVGDAISIVRHVPIEQTTHIPPSGPLDIPAVNIQFSKLVAMLQEMFNGLARSLRLTDSTPGELTIAAPAAGEYLKWNATEDGVESAAVVTPAGSYAIATQSQAEAGTLNNVLMTPLATSYQLAGITDVIEASIFNRPGFGPVVAPWPNAIGDSLFTNLHATTALPALIAAAMGWGSTNTQAVGGATIADQAKIYGFQMTPSLVNPAMVWLGTNDVNLDADSRTNEQTSLEGLRALLFHLAIPTAKRVTGQAMTVAAGSWSNMSAAVDPGGTTIATNSAVKRGTVTGRHVVVAGWANVSSNGTAIVSIGNDNNSITLFGDSITFKRPAVLTNSPGGIPTTTIPFVRIYKNVGANDLSKMTVSVAVTSATGAGNDVFISYVAGISGSQSEAMPLVLCFNLHNYTAAAEVTQSTSGTRRQRFNRGIANIVDEMVGLGLWIAPVDAASVLWDTTRLGADGLHPNNSGNTALTTAAVAVINNAVGYWREHNSRLSGSAYSDTLGTDLLARGRIVIEDFRRVVRPRTAIGSAFSAHSNASNTVTSNATDTVLGWSTELYDINGDFASSTWSPPAGLIHIRAGVTFTAGVDQTAYELKIFKNGSFYKRIGRTSASGTAELFIGGELYDLAAEGDAYTVYVIQASGGNATVDGAASKTYFMGSSAY